MDVIRYGERFSALQRAENSSIVEEALQTLLLGGFSALQRAENSSICELTHAALLVEEVSVLFSEPKIPQSKSSTIWCSFAAGFSALQRAENSSISGAHQSTVSGY